jgi:hypothetical protein
MPPQADDVTYLGDFNTLVMLSETSKRVQRGAFKDRIPRMITIL